MRIITVFSFALAAALGLGLVAAQQPASAAETITVDGKTGDPAKGEQIFRRCMACHSLAEGQNRVGPTLYGIIGRTAGTVPNYRYSKANEESGVTWTPEVMFEYLQNPRKFMPGTKMAFPGLPNPQDRVDVIAYIAQHGGEPAASN